MRGRERADPGAEGWEDRGRRVGRDRRRAVATDLAALGIRQRADHAPHRRRNAEVREQRAGYPGRKPRPAMAWRVAAAERGRVNLLIRFLLAMSCATAAWASTRIGTDDE